MIAHEAIVEFRKMWTWLYKHPAHDQKYYLKHVMKTDHEWQKDCPLCEHFEGNCSGCLEIYDKGNGTLCDDPKSPVNQWRKTQLADPDYRMWYAGKVVNIVEKALK